MGDGVTWSEVLAAVGFLVMIIGAVAGMWFRIHGTIERTRDQQRAGDAELHERINRVRDEFVRRDDLDAHMARIEKTMVEMRAELRAMFDAIMKRD